MSAEAKPKARDGFTTSIGVLVVTLGSAVGLGNIWKFPSLAGDNGGAAFVAIYLLATLVVGLPVMISELVIGRTAKANAIGALRKLAPKQLWWLIGAMGALAAFFILAFYTEVAAWVVAYVFKAIGGMLSSTDPAVTSQAFGNLIADPVQSLLWQWVVLVFVSVIIIAGVSKGIERVVKTLMPVLLLILILTCIRSVTLPGAGEGLTFLFKPDFSKVTFTMILVAMGLSFFKLSVGMGTMITYGSYYKDDSNIPLTALRVMLCDVSISLLAGIAIFPAVFAFGFQPDAGPSLLFITIPAVFTSMPLGNIFMPLFFVLAAIAATGAMLSLLEVPVAFLHEQAGWSRTKATVVTTLILAVFGATAALSNSLLAGVSIFGLSFFDLYDFLTSNIMLPLGGFFICLFVGWRWGWPAVQKALSNNAVLQNEGLVRVFFTLVKYVTPILVLIVLLRGLKVF